MRRSIVRIWILGCLATLLTALTSQALHIKGGWMSYKHMGVDANGNNLYVMTVKVYRDCAPANPQQNDVTINVTIYNNSAPGASAVNIPAPMSTSYRLEKTDWDPCINPRPQVCYVVLQYETGIFALPPSADGYTASFQRCCRINGIVNVAQPSNNLGNTYTISFPGTNPQASNAVNSRPIFKENDTEVVCYDSNIRLDYGASDPDGDSLAYFFLPAINGGSSNQPNPNTASRPPYPPLNYVNPYSPDDPFGTRLYLDPQTGIITGRSPSTTGEYVIAVGVNEFRNGTLIATSRKELHVSVANCGLAAAELPLRITSCNSYTVQFENLSPSPAILTYFWDFGVPNRTDDTSRNAIPVFTYPDTGVYRATLIINRNEACSDTATTEVAVYPGFTPGVRVEGSCFLNPFVFTDTTRAAFGTVNFWRWDFGNPLTSFDTSRLRNPQYTYPAPGTYNTTFIVGSSKGCLDTITVPVQVFNRPALTLPFKDTLIC
ncbi:MAG TPA: PKD domain-containing protein, partial [Phnomibacter sp.]|nr:PKD domain-containing protein [Phnomibacter sp.]